jgi:hypothetical protein
MDMAAEMRDAPRDFVASWSAFCHQIQKHVTETNPENVAPTRHFHATHHPLNNARCYCALSATGMDTTTQLRVLRVVYCLKDARSTETGRWTDI